MRTPREEHRVGLRYLADVTVLLQRIRGAHPTAGLYEAADLQWWWRKPRSTDDLPQLFWFDHLGRPEAAVIATDWGNRIALDPMVMPDATPGWVAHVFERGLAHAGELGFDAVGLETATGLVEPMRTEDDHQRRGLARHILTTGIDLLAGAGAERIKICDEPNNAASRSLYLSAGFEPDRQTVVVSRRTSASAPSSLPHPDAEPDAQARRSSARRWCVSGTPTAAIAISYRIVSASSS